MDISNQWQLLMILLNRWLIMRWTIELSLNNVSFYGTGPVSSINAQAESHGSSSEEVDEPSSRGSSRPNSAHEEEQVFIDL